MFSHAVMRPKMPDGAHRSGPAHRRSATTATARIAPVAAGALLAAALAPLGALPASAETAGMGPVDPANGFPTWYSDGSVKLQLCYEAGKGCLSEPPDPNSPASYPDNFPEEAFWFQASATGGNLSTYEAALEGAHTNGPVQPGEQMGFGRLRFIVDNLTPGASYTITHPYGINTFVAEPDPKVGGRIKQTIDAGVCAPSATVPCDWAGVGAAFLGNYATGTTATFLRQVGAAPGTLGDINTARPVTGAPSGTNAVTITGPNAGGPGVNTLTVNTFTVQGLVADGSDGGPSTPDLATASDSGRSTTDNITRITTPTITGTLPAGAAGPVQLIVDTGAPRATTLTGSSYSATLTALTQGVHSVQARITNPAFAADPTQPQFLTSAKLTFTVDTAAPAVSVTAPFPSSPSLDSTPTLSFTGEAGARFECQLLPSNATWDPTCASPKTWDAQVNGTYVFNVRATDAAGNVSAMANRTVQIGTTVTAPTTKLQDFNSDGKADVVSRDSAGVLWLYRGNGTGGFLAKTKIGAGWNSMTAIVSTGDFNGDRKADIVARTSTGLLYLYKGNGAGGFSTKVQIGTGWNSFNSLTAPGDFNGDRKPDLTVRDASGNLFAYLGNGTGGFTGRMQIGAGWNGMNAIVAPGDFNSDAKADLVARDGAGNLWLYRGDGSGGFLARVLIGAGWNGLSIVAPGDFNGDRKADLTARDSRGNMLLYRGNGSTGFLGKSLIGTGWSSMNAIV